MVPPWRASRAQQAVNDMKKLVLMLLVAAALAGCAKLALGPVDHECHANPARSWGSGCEDYG
jgi:hypothetical protein